jgi:hypothetical protein
MEVERQNWGFFSIELSIKKVERSGRNFSKEGIQLMCRRQRKRRRESRMRPEHTNN